MILEKGTIIANRYEIAELIGAGGMSHVYRALDRKLHRSVTVKVLREEYIGDANFVDRFSREARAIASLSHPNIVNVFDVGNEGDIHFIVMEYIAGKTLKDLIIDKAPFSNETMLGVASQIAAALIHAHENGIIHRDVKPQNVLCMPNGVVKVADFGIAKSHDSKNLVDEFSTMGSVHYISPEVACSDPIDPRSDLYSLGIVMFEMMTGQLPFDSDNADEITMLHVEAPFPNIRKRNPKVLPVVREIIVRLTNKQPFRRYQSASSLYNDIQRAIMESAEEDYRSDTHDDVRTNPFEQRTRPHEIPQRPVRPPRQRPETPAFLGGEGGDKDRPKINLNRRAKERLIIIGGIATAALVIIGLVALVIALLNRGDSFTVPNHMYMELEEARTVLEAAGLYLEIYGEEFHPTVPEGHITQSSHPDGWVVLPGTVVEVIISLGPENDEDNDEDEGELIEVPRLIGMHLDAAVADIISTDTPLTLHYEEFRVDDQFPQNYIISQDPPAGRLVPAGTRIYLTISLGEELTMVTVPELVGQMEHQARSAILLAGLRIGNVIPFESLTHSAGIVTWQSVSAETEILAGSYIDFMVSTGIMEPPDDDDDDDDDDDTPEQNGQEVPPEDDNGQNEDDEPGEEPGDDENDNQNQDQDDVTDQPPALVTRNKRLMPPGVPDDRYVSLTLVQRQPDGSLQTVFMQDVTLADLPIYVPVQGIGSVEFVIYVNNVIVESTTLLFE